VVATNVRLIQNGDWFVVIAQVVVIGMMVAGTEPDDADATSPRAG
jgi:hypothetical protein